MADHPAPERKGWKGPYRGDFLSVPPLHPILGPLVTSVAQADAYTVTRRPTGIAQEPMSHGRLARFRGTLRMVPASPAPDRSDAPEAFDATADVIPDPPAQWTGEETTSADRSMPPSPAPVGKPTPRGVGKPTSRPARRGQRPTPPQGRRPPRATTAADRRSKAGAGATSVTAPGAEPAAPTRVPDLATAANVTITPEGQVLTNRIRLKGAPDPTAPAARPSHAKEEPVPPAPQSSAAPPLPRHGTTTRHRGQVPTTTQPVPNDQRTPDSPESDGKGEPRRSPPPVPVPASPAPAVSTPSVLPVQRRATGQPTPDLPITQRDSNEAPSFANTPESTPPAPVPTPRVASEPAPPAPSVLPVQRRATGQPTPGLPTTQSDPIAAPSFANTPEPTTSVAPGQSTPEPASPAPAVNTPPVLPVQRRATGQPTPDLPTTQRDPIAAPSFANTPESTPPAPVPTPRIASEPAPPAPVPTSPAPAVSTPSVLPVQRRATGQPAPDLPTTQRDPIAAPAPNATTTPAPAPAPVPTPPVAPAQVAPLPASPAPRPAGDRLDLHEESVPVPRDVQHAVQEATGHRPSQVTVRRGMAVNRTAARIAADSYATGGVVHLPGTAPLSSDRSRRLLAHELTHVVQQRTGVAPSQEVSAAGQEAEHQALHAERLLAAGAAGVPVVARTTAQTPREAVLRHPPADPTPTRVVRSTATSAPDRARGLPRATVTPPIRRSSGAAILRPGGDQPGNTERSAPSRTGVPGPSNPPGRAMIPTGQGSGAIPPSRPAPPAPATAPAVQRRSSQQSPAASSSPPSAPPPGASSGGQSGATKAETQNLQRGGPAPKAPVDTATDDVWLQRHAHALFPHIKYFLRNDYLLDRERRGRLMRDD